MRRFGKFLIWLAGTIVVLVIIAVIVIKLFFPVEKVRAMLVERAEAALNRDVTVGSLDVSIWGGLGVKLGNVTLGNPKGWPSDEPFVAVDEVDVKLRLFPLLAGDYEVDRLIIDRPRVNLVKAADGATNYAFELASDTTAPKAPPDTTAAKPAEELAISFDRFVVNKGTLSYRDDSSSVSARLGGIGLNARLERPAENQYSSSGNLSIDSIAAELGFALPVTSMRLEYQADYDQGRKVLNLGDSRLWLNDLRLDLAGQAQTGDTLRGQAHVSSSALKLKELLSFLPPTTMAALKDFTLAGELAVEADLDYEGARPEPLYYSGAVTLSGVTASSSRYPGQLRFEKALLDVKPNNLRLRIEDGSFDGRPLKGHLVVDNFANPTVSGELAGQIDLAFVAPFLPMKPTPTMSGLTAVSAKFDGPVSDPKRMAMSGELSLTKGSIEVAAVPEKLEDVSVDLYFDNNVVNLRAGHARMASGEVDLSGRVNGLMAKFLGDSLSRVAAVVNFEGSAKGTVDLALLNRLVDTAGGTSYSGRAQFDLSAAGRSDALGQLRPRGTVAVINGAMTLPTLPEPIKRLAADLLITPDTIHIKNLAVDFVSSDMALTGKLIRPFPALLQSALTEQPVLDTPVIVFDLTSRHFDTDRMFPEAVPGAAVNAPAPPDSLGLDSLPALKGTGHYHFDTLIYCQVALTDVNGQGRLDKGIIYCDDVTAKVYSGQVTGHTSVDLNDFENPRYDGSFDATQIEADDFVSRFSRFGGHFFGKINLKGDFKATGWDPEPFLKSLTLDGDMAMRDGKLVADGSAFEALSGLAGKLGTSLSKEQVLKSLGTHLKVRDGKVGLDDLTTTLGALGDFKIGGWYGFDGKVEYSGTLLLSTEYSSKLASSGGLLGGLAGLLGDQKEKRLVLPLTITGSTDKPKFDIDYSAIAKQAGENLLNKGNQVIDGLIKKK